MTGDEILESIKRQIERYRSTAPSVYSQLDDTTKALCAVFNVKVD